MRYCKKCAFRVFSPTTNLQDNYLDYFCAGCGKALPKNRKASRFRQYISTLTPADKFKIFYYIGVGIMISLFIIWINTNSNLPLFFALALFCLLIIPGMIAAKLQ